VKSIFYSGTVHWIERNQLPPMAVPTGEDRFRLLIAFLRDYVSDSDMSELKHAIQQHTQHPGSDPVLGYNYTHVYFYHRHEISGLHDVAELVFNWSREMFFLMDIAEFASVTRTLNAAYPSSKPIPISVTLYDAPDFMRRPGSFFDVDDDE